MHALSSFAPGTPTGCHWDWIWLGFMFVASSLDSCPYSILCTTSYSSCNTRGLVMQMSCSLSSTNLLFQLEVSCIFERSSALEDDALPLLDWWRMCDGTCLTTAVSLLHFLCFAESSTGSSRFEMDWLITCEEYSQRADLDSWDLQALHLL